MADNNPNQYQLDLTGENPDNLVVDEAHSLVRQRNRALALKHGAFYVDSLVITHTDTGYVLRHLIDYKLLQPLPTLSSASGKKVCGIILIHNSIIHQNLSITYQCVGGAYEITSTELQHYLNTLKDDDPSYSWYNDMVKDETESIDTQKVDTFDFHHLCYNIEKVRNTIIWSDSPYYDRVRMSLNNTLDSIEVQTRLALDVYIEEAFGNFKADINKAFIGLGNVQNLTLANNTEARSAAESATRITDFEANKYMALNTLNTFKQVIYDRFVLLSTTNIGRNRGIAINPGLSDLLNTVNGSIFILKSKEQYTEENIAYDGRVYPPESTIYDEYTVLRINNNNTDRGGLFLFSERFGKRILFAYHPNGNPEHDFQWNKIIKEEDLEELSVKIGDHLINVDNPHNTDKTQVGLDKMENLPVVSREEILALQSCKKYLTMDGLMLFFKTYMVGEGAAAEDPRNDDRDHVQIIYTAQSEDKCLPPPCPCPDIPEPEPEPEPEPPPPLPVMVKVSQFANTEYDPNYWDEYGDWEGSFTAKDSNFDTYSMVGTYGYEDGTGQFKQEIAPNTDCALYSSGLGLKTFDIECQVKRDDDVWMSSYKGDSVYPGDTFFFDITAKPYTEYLAVLVVPGKTTKFIRGKISAYGRAGIEGQIPHENMTGYDYYDTNAAVVLQITEYDDRKVDPTDERYKFHLITGEGQSNPYGGITYTKIDAKFDNHIADESGNISGKILIENLIGGDYAEDGSFTIDRNYRIAADWFTDGWDEGGDMPNFEINIPSGTIVSASEVERIGNYAIEVPFTFNISSLPNSSNIFVYFHGEFSSIYAGFYGDIDYPIYKNPNITYTEKSVPVFIDGVASGSITLRRNNTSGICDIVPYFEDQHEDHLTTVYFFEKDTTTTDPFVFLIDVWKDDSKLTKSNGETFQEYINSINATEISRQYENVDLGTLYSDVKANLDVFKAQENQRDKEIFTRYFGTKSVTVEEFDSITKVRRVLWKDDEFSCLLPVEPPNLNTPEY